MIFAQASLEESLWRSRRYNTEADLHLKSRDRRDRRHRSPLRVILGWVFFIALILALLFGLVPLAGAKVRLTNSAMSPALSSGDTVLVNHIAYVLFSPKRSDVIQFTSSADNGNVYVRRVVGLPGETIQILDGSVYVNGEKLTEPYSSGQIQYAGTASTPVTLAEDEYFVLADNRANGFDSRDPTVGMVNLSSIKGKVWLRVLPVNQFGLVS